MVSLSKSLQQFRSLPNLFLVLFLLLLIAWGAVPSYLKKSWAWENPPIVPHLKELKELRKSGLTIDGWQTSSQEMREVSGHKWSYQNLQNSQNNQAVLLLLPQVGIKEQPQVEWVDIKGFWRWKTDKHRSVQFNVGSKNNPSQSIAIKANYFQAWNPKQTYAVLQWYAFPNGGNPEPNNWFWADQIAQWQGHRVPWVAVNIQIPIEPLGDIQKVWPLAESLGKSVQLGLMAGALEKKSK